MLEAAAKACGLIVIGYSKFGLLIRSDGCAQGYVWAPHDTPTDCAEMCAKLEINHEHHSDYIQCLWAPQETYHVITMLKDHDNSRLKAWMHAATMVAAKIGGYKE